MMVDQMFSTLHFRTSPPNATTDALGGFFVKSTYFCCKLSAMQYIIEIRPDQDVQFLLTLLEKMQVVVRPIELPKKTLTKAINKPNTSATQPETAAAPAPTFSQKYAGKLSAETADRLLEYVEQCRNEWERTF